MIRFPVGRATEVKVLLKSHFSPGDSFWMRLIEMTCLDDAKKLIRTFTAMRANELTSDHALSPRQQKDCREIHIINVKIKAEKKEAREIVNLYFFL